MSGACVSRGLGLCSICSCRRRVKGKPCGGKKQPNSGWPLWAAVQTTAAMVLCAWSNSKVASLPAAAFNSPFRRPTRCLSPAAKRAGQGIVFAIGCPHNAVKFQKQAGLSSVNKNSNWYFRRRSIRLCAFLLVNEERSPAASSFHEPLVLGAGTHNGSKVGP